MDLVGLAEEHTADRIINLFESIILEEQMRNQMVPEDGRIKFRSHMRTLREGGTIDMEDVLGAQNLPEPPVKQNTGWTNDATYRQPPRYIEPTENGYPGLEPPVG